MHLSQSESMMFAPPTWTPHSMRVRTSPTSASLTETAHLIARDDVVAKFWRSSSMHRRKVFPGFTTLITNTSFHTRDSSSFLVDNFLSRHSLIKCWSSCNFPSGKRISIFRESNSKPKNLKHTHGPSSLFSATGRPRRWKTLNRMSRAFRHSSKFGTPIMR